MQILVTENCRKSIFLGMENWSHKNISSLDKLSKYQPFFRKDYFLWNKMETFITKFYIHNRQLQAHWVPHKGRGKYSP